MRKFWFYGSILSTTLFLLSTIPALAAAPIELEANLSGFRQVPSVSTNGHGSFDATINADRTIIHYTLTFHNLSSNSKAAHIHFAQRDVNGGVLAFLCGEGGKPPCPISGGTIEGTIVAADIHAIAAQGIVEGDIAAVVRAISRGATYVNVHSVDFPDGEIRGQIEE